MKRRELEAAAAAGWRRPVLTATLPRVRCTPEERERADQLASAAGISLAEHIRRRAIAPEPKQ